MSAVHVVFCATLLTSAGVTAAGVALAADQRGHYNVMGMGIQSCGAYTEARSLRTDWEFRHWVAGYISATNALLPDTHDITGKTDLLGILGWLDNFCRENPTRQFSTAAMKAVDFLYPTRQKSEPK